MMTKEQIVTVIQSFIFGKNNIDTIREKILGYKFVGEGTSIYKEIPVVRRMIFKILKTFKNGFLYFPIIILKSLKVSRGIYFQGIKLFY